MLLTNVYWTHPFWLPGVFPGALLSCFLSISFFLPSFLPPSRLSLFLPFCLLALSSLTRDQTYETSDS